MSPELEEPALALVARLSRHGERGVRRVSIDVLGEQVTFTRREAGVQAVCSCGVEGCEHYRAALRFFGDEPVATLLPAPAPKQRASSRPAAPSRGGDAEALAEALEELCLATARAGTSAHDSPSIRAALDQLIASAPQPLPLCLLRFIGRFHDALEVGEVAGVARALAGAQRWAEEVRRGDRGEGALARRRAWLGSLEGEAPGSLTDVTLVEVGREWLSGLTRSSLERRYLVDVANGQLYAEERRRGEQDISVGPCPRVVHVAFGELDTATEPPRARLLQYTVSAELAEAHWERLAELGETRLPELLTRYADAARRCPGLAEPVVLFAPRELTDGSAGSLRDAMGSRLELRDDQEAPAADTLRELAAEGDLVWVAGRLKGGAAGLSLRPISLLVRKQSKVRLWRVT
jgi:hypothetical protein